MFLDINTANISVISTLPQFAVLFVTDTCVLK